jgi:hypothetical protein
MFDQFLVPAVSAALFGTSAYFITQSKSCPCPEVDETKRSYILGFSYVGIIYSVLLFVIGSSAFKLLSNYPILALVLALFEIGKIAYAILTIQYTYTLKACKCEATLAEKITYIASVLRLIVSSLLLLFVGFVMYMISTLSSADRKHYMSVIKNAINRSK